MIAEIAFPVPLRRTFYYRVKEELRAFARPGLRVLASFGPRKMTGIIMKLHDDAAVDLSGFKELKSIESFLDQIPAFKDDIPEISAWMQDRWNAPVGLAVENFYGQFLADAFPSGPTAGVESPAGAFLESVQPPLLSSSLIDIAAELSVFVGADPASEGQAHVLFGAPQNGRYDVYLELARKAVAGGGQVLCLVPDLNLIAPFEERLRAVFKPEALALWHSRLTPKQRREAWHGVRNGEVQVVVGARSAVFLPFKRLALALVDEEQDDIYKQEEQEPNFHSRDLLLKRAGYHKTCVILASAAPSMEACAGVEGGCFTWNELPRSGHNRPKVSIIDMGQRRWEIFSDELAEKLKKVKAGNKQALVLAGRKGYSSLLVCANCGWIKRCGRCRIPMGVKKIAETIPPQHGRAATADAACGAPSSAGLGDGGDACQFVCWRCGRKEPVPDLCPACSGKVFRESGAGTQKVEAYLKKLLPGSRVARCDGDVVRKSAKDARAIYDEFAKGDIDVLVGTRLLARGHSFQNLGVIGVVDSDAGLSAADFRASEKIFQTLMEAGAALFETQAPEPELIVQTRQPGNYIFSVLPELDYLKFAKGELAARRDFFYPPFAELVRISFASFDAKAIAEFSEAVLKVLDAPAGDEAEAPSVEILGPMVFNDPKKTKVVREYYLVKLADEKALAWCLGRLRTVKPPKTVKFKITADPYSFK
ncbi:MAG: primosomal protein N' [Elusimicrobia bacterium RIFOXYA12_FULL_51_18]|nr:MAG: primosomal protein N' [Elusimicrobia bacterium RIFOXYA12_FULL_51_18]OGS29423.1 MAG: primosomal protein N' [Elusimicrobia bacterium RIFOXYA2_FULL_53_38]